MRTLTCLRGVLRSCGDGGPCVEVLQDEKLQDLVEVLNGGAVQVLLVVVERVPHGGERRGDEVEDVHT